MRQRGVALAGALLIALVVALGLVLLFNILTRFFRAGESVRTYTTIQAAAEGGVQFALSVMPQLVEEFIPNRCTTLNLPCRVEGRSSCSNTVQVCYEGYSYVGGTEVSGAMYEPLGGTAAKGLLIRIISTATADGQSARVEALVRR
ncbi:hypothetical protein [Thermocrinis albus]|nr:hypothetical protein [Thermocrinis albus]